MSTLARVTDDIAALVGLESPSADLTATERCARLAAEIGTGWVATAPELVERAGRTHLLWSWGDQTRVLLVGHLDTVWPLGTLARWPFEVEGDRATGPGVFDMKTGVVQLFAAVQQLADRDGVSILLTTDEEVGSPTSRELIEQTATGAHAALVLEPGVAGALKVARKGVSSYTLAISGRAAHAGLEPEKGINAALEAAAQTAAVARLADPDHGTTVTPTGLRAGSAVNTVPASAELDIDVRALTTSEQHRVDRALRELVPTLAGSRLELRGDINRPPLEHRASAALFALADQVANDLGQPRLRAEAVGGGSDGNFTAGLGVPTLDGLGAVGANAHAEGEWADLSAVQPRANLVAELVRRLLALPADQQLPMNGPAV
jgi:glutamate carboxypeptidase